MIFLAWLMRDTCAKGLTDERIQFKKEASIFGEFPLDLPTSP
jgi:hypothetical protein